MFADVAGQMVRARVGELTDRKYSVCGSVSPVLYRPWLLYCAGVFLIEAVTVTRPSV